MKIRVKQWRPGSRYGEWRIIGVATTWRGAERIAKRVDDPQGFSGYRHPNGGPKYGVIIACAEGRQYGWDHVLGQFSI